MEETIQYLDIRDKIFEDWDTFSKKFTISFKEATYTTQVVFIKLFTKYVNSKYGWNCEPYIIAGVLQDKENL